jgi:ferredoxin-type protein NapH
MGSKSRPEETPALQRPSLRFWRRTVQIGVAAAFVAIPYLNLKRIHVLSGNFLSFDAAGVPLADPLAAVQVVLKSRSVTFDLLVGTALALLLAWTLGTVFCSWICPFGLLSEWVHSWSRRLLPRSYQGLRGRGDGSLVRLVLFGALFLAFLVFAGGPVLNQLSLPAWYSRLFQLYVAESYVTPAVFLLAGVLAAEFLAKSRVWCRYACPQAVLLSLTGLLNPWRLRVVYEPQHCTCKKGADPCRTACPLSLDPRRLRHPLERECNNCGDCYVTCRNLGKALRFRLGPRCLR